MPFLGINGFHGHQDANLRRDLYQAPGSHSMRLRPARSGAVGSFHSMRTRARSFQFDDAFTRRSCGEVSSSTNAACGTGAGFVSG